MVRRVRRVRRVRGVRGVKRGEGRDERERGDPIELLLVATYCLLVLHCLDGDQKFTPGIIVKVFRKLGLFCDTPSFSATLSERAPSGSQHYYYVVL